MNNHKATITGILLAAGRGQRFDPSGLRNKLLQDLPDGDLVAVRSARNLLAALERVIAVVRPGADRLSALLLAQGCEVVVCPTAEQGMAASLADGVRASSDAFGWVFALADMPFVKPETMRLLRQAIEQESDIAVPLAAGRRGNPVAFGRKHLAELLALQGDQGARQLLQRYPVTEVRVDDAGIHRDIDTVSDLSQPQPTALKS